MNEYIESSNISTTCCTVDGNNNFYTHCLICGDSVVTSMWGSHICICDKCKKAVLYIRDQLEKEEKNGN